MASYNRGDYVPAIRLFRRWRRSGNAKAQHLIGVMYRKGQGVAQQLGARLLWFSVAAKTRRPPGEGENAGGVEDHDAGRNRRRRAKWRHACEASNYRGCEY